MIKYLLSGSAGSVLGVVYHAYVHPRVVAAVVVVRDWVRRLVA